MKLKINSFSWARRIAMIGGVITSALIATQCSSSDDATPTPTSTASVKLTTSTTLGNYITDRDGNTLYFFSNDAKGANTCTGGCATVWPIFYEADLSQTTLSEGLLISDFGTITTTDAKQQTTYKGWPLYYYAPGGKREAANQTTGEAVGNIWYVAKPDYSIMLAKNQLTGLDGKNYTATYTEGDASVQYFTDSYGRTLYAFLVDKKNKNNFSTGDEAHDAHWPVYSQSVVSLPSTLDKSLFGTIQVIGKTQLTYKGWPMYYFGNDSERGDTKGVSVPTPGVWPVAVKDATEAPESPTASVKLTTSTTLGNYLTDGDGNTLYFFSNDANGTNTCTGGCATAWPIFYKADLTQAMLSEGLLISDFGTITNTDANQQTTYKGWPLYYYAPGGQREAANQTTGEAVGTVWYVAKPDYSIMITKNQLTGADGKNYTGTYTEGDAKVQYFTDAYGRTLYAFSIDKKNKNNFSTGDDAHDATWPVYSQSLASIPSTLDKSLFGTIQVADKSQLTYKGWPMYYFGNDSARGDNKGVSVPTPGIWPVVVKDATEAPE